MGFSSIKGFGDSGISVLLEKQPFSSLEDFLEKIKKTKVNKGSIERLVLSGACDLWLDTSSNENRMSLLYRAYEANKIKHTITLENIKEFNDKELLYKEKALLGSYFSGHPLDDIATPILWEELNPKEKVTSHAMLSEIKEIITKKGDAMAFLELSYVEKDISAVIFPDAYNKVILFRGEERTVGSLLKTDMVLKVRGYLNYNAMKDAFDFIVDKIEIPILQNKKILDGD